MGLIHWNLVETPELFIIFIPVILISMHPSWDFFGTYKLGLSKDFRVVDSSNDFDFYATLVGTFCLEMLGTN